MKEQEQREAREIREESREREREERKNLEAGKALLLLAAVARLHDALRGYLDKQFDTGFFRSLACYVTLRARRSQPILESKKKRVGIKAAAERVSVDG